MNDNLVTLEQIKQKQEELNAMIKIYENQPKKDKKIESGWIGEYINDGLEDNYYIETYGNIDSSDLLDEEQINCLNAFKTKEKAEEIAFKQLLFRKLQKFSDENGGNEIGRSENKYYIWFDTEQDYLDVSSYDDTKDFGGVYFKSGEIAEKAIELFKDDLVKYFTQY